MTFNEIIYDVREKLKLGSDDIDIQDEYIAHLINVKRALLIKQRYTKFSKAIPEESKQIVCIDLELVDSIEGEKCFGDILRSIQTLPAFIQVDSKPSLTNVMGYDLRAIPMSITAIERFPYLGYNKWTNNQLHVALGADSKLYFYSGNDQYKFLEKVKVVGLFENPESADELSCDTSSDCDYFDKKYPVEPHMVHDIVNLIARELLPSIKLVDDKLNNADESPR